MKYIKRYNEAIGPKLTRREWVEEDEKGQKIMATQSVPSTGINPETLRRAGSVASGALQTDKAEALRDYADIKQYGYYNMTVLKNGSGTSVKGIKVTNCNITNVKYGVTKRGQSSSQVSGGDTADDIINRWKGKDWFNQGSFNGDCLGLTFDVSVKILNSGKSDLRNKGGQQFETLVKQYTWIPFSMSLIISSYTHGMKDFLTCDSCSGSGKWECYECDGAGTVWDADADDDVPCRDCEGKPVVECEDCSGRGFVSAIWKDGKKIDIEIDENGNPIYDQHAFFDDTITCR
jgi:DnaJ-class molecular chaperone